MGQRLLYIDVIKVLAIYMVIAGHLFPIGYEYLYTVHVPIFLVVSGYLTKREKSLRVFFAKVWKKLLIPLILLFLINWVIDIVLGLIGGSFDINILYRPFVSILGFGYIKPYGGLVALWYVYTLFFLKCICQLIEKDIYQFLILIICVILAVLWNHYQAPFYDNALINISLSYPFFFLGVYLKRYNSCNNDNSLRINSFVASLICLGILLVSGYFNGAPWLYMNTYGKSLMLFIIGSLSGIYFFVVFAKLLSSICKNETAHKIIINLSDGVIIILGLHQLFLRIYPKLDCGNSWGIYLFALFVLFSFYPIIRIH